VLSKLGVDVGGVILYKHHSSSKEIPGAVDALFQLAQAGVEVHIISACFTDKMRLNTMEWFEDNQFYGRSGVSIENVHFVKQREQKLYKLRVLGVNAFIDDRDDIIDHLHSGGIGNLYWFNIDGINPKRPKCLQNPGVTEVQTWGDVLFEIL